jgi:phosphoserine aminotransferase
MHNIPASFTIYTLGGYLQYTSEHGAVAYRMEQADTKSGLLYKATDDFDGFYTCPVDERAAPVCTVPLPS